MAALGKFIKEQDPDAKVVFIGPCTSKKAEVRDPKVSPYVDYVMTFEELQAMIDSKDIEVDKLPETDLDHASGYGRKFARIGGVSEAVARAVEENGAEEGFEFNPIVCEGVDQCKVALLRASKGVLPNNFIEGMVCKNGCIGGAACLSHGNADRKEIDLYGESAGKKNLSDSVTK